ncbi:uncharacterized protein, homolog of Cu resistance protein CopC [Microbacterium testaceum StLB037]|uniref:Uncharacterized protein, homolog of Cu resistance protein CopC n=1 Tax=Microbacterium testaceum (strain StLB037) TaxID=979556 RepID=E8N872_MICTS|nr:copper resistance CopC family protein [Microbacterium testaceum]BAJ73092.1 uncharacterized protein, homolog of Cu resistance protein CopC [Microbacterium testaceum StLB037]
MTSSAPRRSLSTVLASLVLAVVALFVLPAAPAFAHDELVSTDPAADAVLDALPGQITFTYSADILTEEGTAVVEVTDADGASLTEGAPVVSGTDVTQTLAGAASGPVTVVWRVVSSDGHPIDGTFSFTVNAASPTPTATTATPTAAPTPSETALPTTATPDATATPSETVSTASPLPWILLVVALVIVAGAIVWLFVARGRRGSSGGGSAGTSGR